MSRQSGQAPLNDEDLSAEEVRQIWRSRARRRALAIGLPSLLLVIVVAALALPRIKDWRARKFAAQAAAFRAEGKLQEAFSNASSAMQMRPHLPESRRAFASVLLAAGKAEGLAMLQQLVEEGTGTPEDHLALAEAALRFGDVPLAEREASQLLRQGGKTGGALHILALVRLAQQRDAEAMQLLQECLDAGGDANAAILLARLQFAANTPDSTAAATALLTPLTAQNDATGLAALMLLLDSPAMRSQDARQWIEAVRAHPLAGDEQKLAAADAEIRVEPGARAAVLARMMNELRNGAPEQQAQLARWLNQKHEYDAVLEMIPIEKALGRGDLFLIRLDAMAGKGNWKEIAEILQKPNLPLQPPIVMLYRGRAARETGDDASAAALYRRAASEAATTPEMLWYVVGYLERIGEYEILEQELLKLTSNPTIARQAFAALVPIVQKRRDAGELYALYERMIKLLPSDRTVQNDLRYFAAITGRRVDTAGARELLDVEPRMLASRITLALTLLKDGKPQDALHVFDGVTLDPAQILPYQRAILAAVLGASGRESEARQLADAILGDSITTQEMELIRRWRTKN